VQPELKSWGTNMDRPEVVAAGVAALAVIALLFMLSAFLGGCVSLGLTDKNDRTPEFWRGLERQSGGTS
jgi:hypothetical protein